MKIETVGMKMKPTSETNPHGEKGSLTEMQQKIVQQMSTTTGAVSLIAEGRNVIMAVDQGTTTIAGTITGAYITNDRFCFREDK